MLNVLMLNVLMLNVLMLNIVMLSVVAPCLGPIIYAFMRNLLLSIGGNCA
jgi:hypothetical protein